MRDQPLLINAIAGKSPAQVIVNSSAMHHIQGAFDQEKGAAVIKLGGVMQQEVILVAYGKLRNAFHSAMNRIGHIKKKVGGFLQLFFFRNFFSVSMNIAGKYLDHLRSLDKHR